ncbi:pyridine nucleotide-disulfide oxidoreductase [Clostridiales bacterium COT073_COT-073]|nr:pyridine nucleotide-disulfide oxidoreductase [Clostridiales bacterium COT073_COT-073]
MNTVELVIIGGGSAGMAAACGAYEAGVRDILILERDKELGGILLQCIHNGFGLHYYKEELSGPEYAERWEKKIEEYGIAYRLDTMVLDITADKVITYTNTVEGYTKVRAKAIVLAMGCRERTRGAIHIPGFRPAGVWTAGTAQRYLNMEGYLVGRRIFILGSGDIGLIMARRMTLEGAEVLGVAEIMPYSNGLPRNIQQCLRDFEIPLYLSHTVTNVFGKDRVSGIEISQVNQKFEPIAGTEKRFDCDTLLLSVGLIPETQLGQNAGVLLSPKTKGALVNDINETETEGIFSCGNVLHVHDVVDFVSEEGLHTGKNAAAYLQNKLMRAEEANVSAGAGIGYVLPQRVRKTLAEAVTFSFRVTDVKKNAELLVKVDGKVVKSVKKRQMIPAEMERITLKAEELNDLQSELVLEIRED